MKTQLLIAALAVLILSASANAQTKKGPKQADWLVGGWVGEYRSKPFYEAWRWFNDSSLVNFIIEVNGTDTIVKENGMMRIGTKESYFQSRSAKWIIPNVTDTSLILVNDTLKYANEIYWSRSSKDHWLTKIVGSQGIQHYDMVRLDWVDRVIDRYIAKHTR